MTFSGAARSSKTSLSALGYSGPACRFRGSSAVCSPMPQKKKKTCSNCMDRAGSSSPNLTTRIRKGRDDKTWGTYGRHPLGPRRVQGPAERPHQPHERRPHLEHGEPLAEARAPPPVERYELPSGPTPAVRLLDAVRRDPPARGVELLAVRPPRRRVAVGRPAVVAQICPYWVSFVSTLLRGSARRRVGCPPSGITSSLPSRQDAAALRLISWPMGGNSRRHS